MDTEIPSMNETIALTEKKVAMALDDIIKLSKSNANVNKGKKPRREKNKNQNFKGARRNNTSKFWHHMNSLSAVRQGAVAKRSSNFQVNQFPVTANLACTDATTTPPSVRGRAFNARRMTSANQSRLIASPVQNRFTQARFIAKRHEVVENGGGKQRTLDSRFACLKEHRESNKSYGVGVQVQRLPPWARPRRFPN